MSIVVGDLVQFRTGFRSQWREGFVREIGAHLYKITVLGSDHVVVVRTGGPGRKGKVRELTGRRCVEVVEAARLPLVPPATAVTLRVLQGGLGAAVPRPRARFRSPLYLTHVRALPCLSCAAPGPSDAHHSGSRGVGQKADDFSVVPLCRRCHAVVTDTGALPGRTREETVLLVLRAQVAQLSAWAAEQQERVADHVEVPVLARCAS